MSGVSNSKSHSGWLENLTLNKATKNESKEQKTDSVNKENHDTNNKAETPKDSVKTEIPNNKNTVKEQVIDKIRQSMKFSEPTDIVDEIKNAKGDERIEKLVDFKSKLDGMSKGELREVRDYLVKIISDPNNDDDKTLGTLLKTVNKEIDSKSINNENPLKPNRFVAD